MIGRDINKKNKPLKKTRRKKSAQAVRVSKSAPKQNNIMGMSYVLKILQHSYFQAALLITLLLAAFMWLQQQVQTTQWLPIEQVKVNGHLQYLSAAQLKQQALQQAQGGFFNVNLQQIRKTLEQQPWVETVAVRRIWPNALGVMVVEKQAVAFWGRDQLLSTQAVLFKPSIMPTDLLLPRLIGPEGLHKNMFVELGRMQAWLLSTGLQIQKLTLDARRSWTLIASNIEIRLGRKQYNERLQRFAAVFKPRLQKQQQQIQHIDMRYSNGFAIAWKEA